MELDDEVCLCFHVTKRKILNFIRREKPRRPGQLSDCFGAGTGCGWCRRLLVRYFDEAAAAGTIDAPAEPSAAEYAQLRAGYLKSGQGVAPAGSTPAASDESSEA
ncbi:MAG TPA: (2Fe-2S)-binding protein [Pirellulales bacterium]